MLSIFAYLDYRKFLREFIAAKKREAQHFSHRFLHAKLGVSPTSGFIANVVAGKKNLTRRQVKTLSHLLQLSTSESSFFELLVIYNQAKDAEEKDELFRHLMNRQRLKLKKLLPEQQGIFSRKEHVFIFELLGFYNVKDNFDEIGKLLDPPVSPSDVRECLTKLEQMHLIHRDEQGYYRQCDTMVSTGDEVQSIELAHFQYETIDLARRALQNIPAPERDISVVTSAFSKKGFLAAKELARAFRKDLLKVAENDTDIDRVYHCNIQLFPVSRLKGAPR